MTNTPHRLEKELYDLVEKDEQIFKFIETSSLDGMWYWDLENPEHEWMSERFWTTLGYEPSKMKHLASEWQDIINQSDLEVAFDNFTKHCNDPKHPYDQIVRYQHKLGHTVWIRCRGLAIRDEDGKPIRMLGAHTDLTDLKNTEEKLLNTLKSRDLFFAKMSHEIRTPLHGIIGLTDLLKTANQDPSLTKTINTISSCGEQLLVLLDDLLTISKLVQEGMSLSKEPVQLSVITGHVIDLFSAKADAKQLNLKVDIPEDIANKLILTDKVRFIQIISNLVANAIKFTYTGTVTISAQLVEQSLRLLITDTGRGITDVTSVLKPYSQENIQQFDDKGTGLGLEIVSRLCNLLQHDLTIESVPNKGTTVAVTCSIANTPDTAHTSEKEPEFIADLAFDKVLIVDDNEINVEIACQMLKETARTIERAYNGEEAVQMVVNNGDYDLILMDLNMPIKDGFTAAKEILQVNTLAKTPIIVAVSADAFDETLQACTASGMQGHIKKPFTQASLLRCLSAL